MVVVLVRCTCIFSIFRRNFMASCDERNLRGYMYCTYQVMYVLFIVYIARYIVHSADRNKYVRDCSKPWLV